MPTVGDCQIKSFFGGRAGCMRRIRNHELLRPLYPTWTPKVCKIMASMAVIMGLGLLFYILLGCRYTLPPNVFIEDTDIKFRNLGLGKQTLNPSLQPRPKSVSPTSFPGQRNSSQKYDVIPLLKGSTALESLNPKS